MSSRLVNPALNPDCSEHLSPGRSTVYVAKPKDDTIRGGGSSTLASCQLSVDSPPCRRGL